MEEPFIQDTIHVLMSKAFRPAKLALHFRTASSAGKGQEQAHPYQIGDSKIYFMANGNLSHFQGDRKRSDIQVFRDEVLRPAVEEKIFYSDKFNNWLEDYCVDNFTKMLFMDSTGYVKIVNESQGVWDYSDDGGGCWFSNSGIENYIGYGFSGLYEYGENQVRHKRGLITSQVLGYPQSVGWGQCKSCSGWFPWNELISNREKHWYCHSCELLHENPGSSEMRNL
jgi:hypothetical protein